MPVILQYMNRGNKLVQELMRREIRLTINLLEMLYDVILLAFVINEAQTSKIVEHVNSKLSNMREGRRISRFLSGLDAQRGYPLEGKGLRFTALK